MRTMIRSLALVPIFLVSGLAGAPSATAQPATGVAGSVLIFPLIDSRPESSTVITVTNTNTSTRSCDSPTFDEGDVRVHFIYFGATQEDIDNGTPSWREFDRGELLTPGDTITVLASEHNPEGEIGFLMVQAIDRSSGDAIDFDFLIGSAYVANSAIDIMWSYLPYAFEGDPDGNAVQTTSCGHPRLGGGFEARFDGDMYDPFPDLLFVDMFFEEEPGLFDNMLVLMSAAGPSRQNEVGYLFWNNKEDRFSRTQRFTCWMASPLSEISGIARNLGGDPDEFQRETGWVEIDGRRILNSSGGSINDPQGPPMLGVFMQRVRTDYTAGHALHFRGTQTNAVIP